MNRFKPARRLLATAASFAALSVTVPAHAAEPEDSLDLARASGCLSCHSPTEKIVGPAFGSVAARYANQRDAVDELMMSVQNGSVRKWGRAAMPSQSNLPATDVKRLVEWVLRTPQVAQPSE